MKKKGAIIIEGHVQGLANTRALGRLGIPVIVLDREKRCLARYSKYCSAFYQCPDYYRDDLADFLIDLVGNKCLKKWIVLPSNDHVVYTLSRNKERLRPYLEIITESLLTIEKIINKDRLLGLAHSVGVPSPKTWYLQSKDDSQIKDLCYPVVTKGRNGLTFFKKCHMKAFLAENQFQLRKQLDHIERLIPINETFTQEVIPDHCHNKTESFTAFSIDGDIKAHWTGVKLREHPLRFGTATFCKSIDGSHLLSYGEKILRGLRYSGVCEIEFLKDYRDNEYKLIEMNARTWLWVGLAIKCGINYPEMVYDYLNGGGDKIYPGDYKKDVYWRNLLIDIPYGLLGVLKNRFHFSDLFPKKNTVSAIFQWNDIIPYIRFLMLFFFLVKKRT